MWRFAQQRQLATMRPFAVVSSFHPLDEEELTLHPGPATKTGYLGVQEVDPGQDSKEERPRLRLTAWLQLRAPRGVVLCQGVQGP